ncbi:MAG: CoA transferase subunit A [Bacteriovoracaceae bacterium]|nr:CoA transferase subunit A [Bacteriovoracaceae bacterium]
MANPKIITAEEAAALVEEKCRLMCGAFLAVGSPKNIIDALVKQGTKNLHLIAIAPDYDDKGMGKLVASGQVTSMQISWHGSNRASQNGFNSGEIDIEFNPQGILMERIRASGAGLGGFLSPVGLNTVIEEKRGTIELDGKKWVLERPIHGDIAILRAKKADKLGNLTFSKTARNCNPVMAMAAKTVIVEVDEIVETGEIDPEHVISPSVFTDYLVLHK